MPNVLIFVQMVLAMFLGTIALAGIQDFKLRAAALIVMYVFTAAIAVFQMYIQFQVDFKNQYDGILSSPIISTSTEPAFVFGDVVLNWNGASDTPQFELEDGDYFEESMIGGKVNITLQIRDKNGNLIGDIINNHWRIYSPQFILDRNFNSNSLEIKDLKGDITFQVRLEGNKVYLAGYFYPKSGNGQKLFIQPWVEDIMFLYPSIENPRKLNPNAISPGGSATFKFSPQ
jgi:hypothetical protein